MARDEVDLENMTDEEFMNLDPSSFPIPEREGIDEDDASATRDEKEGADDEDGDQKGENSAAGEDDDASDDDTDTSDKDGESDDAAGESSAEGESESGSEESEGTDDDEGGVDDDDAEAEEKDGESSNEEKDSSSSEDDAGDDEAKFAAIGREIMGDFTANGKTMRVKSAADAIQLMQMGANYHKKMRGLKPSLKSLKLLERHGLLEEGKLNFLIDLSQNKPEAIKKLLRDGKIDPVDLDMDEGEDYVPPTRTVSDTEVDLDEVLQSISGTKTYNRTLTVIGDQWDETSREALAKEPTKIRVINAHMEAGIFDQVVQEVEYQRSLGNLSGVSDFDAYQQVGGYMHQNNMIKGATGNADTSGQDERQDTGESNTGESDTQRQSRKARKKAVSPSRRKKTPPAKKKDEYNPLEMSDEEFVKLHKLNI